MMTLKRILVATDFSEPADAALTYGRALAQSFHATLHVLHIVPDMFTTWTGGEAVYAPLLGDMQQEVDASAKKQLDERVLDSDGSGPATTAVMRKSSAPAWVIVQYARDENIDLIVIGTHGRQAMARFLLGSVAEKVVRTAPCPVLTVRHPEHEFVLPDALVVAAKA